MDRFKYSALSHKDFAYCNPISAQKMENIYNLVTLRANARVIDFGSGKAELLLRLIERFQVQAVGLELSPYFLQEARAQAEKRVQPQQLELLDVDATTYEVQPGSVALAACIGASEIFGGYQGALQRLSQMVEPGGYVLIGEAYWKREPEPAYLEAFGVARDEYLSHAENVRSGASYQLLPLYATVSSDDDWDHYEWLHSTALEQYGQQHPEDPDVPALLERIRGWRELYLQWGRDTLGFAIYLFQRI